MIPPIEAESGNVVWKYGLADVPRNWYLTAKARLTKIGVKTSKYDPTGFYYYAKNELKGVLAAHVHDFCWGSNQIFIDEIISPIKKLFNVGSESSKTFCYLGIDLSQNESKQIFLNQTKFIEDINQIIVSKQRSTSKHENLNTNKLESFRTLIGQLGCVSGESRPGIAFEISELSSKVKHATIEDLMRAMKILQRVKS